MKVWIRCLILFVLGATSVLPTLFAPFIFDDSEAIVKNEDVTQLNGNYTLLRLFRNDFWGSSIQHPHSHKSYRPLTTLTYRLDFILWGLNPFPYHVMNLIIHGLNCILVYYFLAKCFQIYSSTNSLSCKTIRLNKKTQEQVFWAAIIFAVHPVHVEPNGAVVGRADLLSSFIVLAGFLLLPTEHTSSYQSMIVSLLAITGSFFKENAIMIAVLYVALRVCNKQLNSLTLKEIVHYMIIILLLLSFILLRIWFQGGPPKFQKFDNPPAFAETLFSRAISIAYIWVFNCFILILPMWLCYDWSMGCLEIIENYQDFRFITTVISLGILFYVTVTLRSREIRISLLVAIIFFIPSSNLIFTVGFVLAERNLYIPSIGFSLLLSYCFHKTNFSKYLMIFVVLIFYIRSIHRSTQWLSEQRLFESGLEVCPNNAKVHYNLGTMYGDQENISAAVQSYRQAIYLKPDYYQAMNNLGNILRNGNSMKEAEKWLRRALEVKDNFPPAWMNLGIVLSKTNPDEALKCYQNALKFRKHYPDCEYNMGNLYLQIGKSELAMQAWINAIKLKPLHTQAWLNLIILCEQEGKLIEAKEWANKAIQILGLENTVLFLLGNIHGRLSEFEMAEKYFLSAIKISQTSGHVPAKYWSNLGVLYHRWGKQSKAVDCYEKALQLDPDMESTQLNLKRLQKSEK